MYGVTKKTKRTTIEIEAGLYKRLKNAEISFKYAFCVGARHLLGDETRLDKSYKELQQKVVILTSKLEAVTRRLWLIQNPEVAEQVETAREQIRKRKADLKKIVDGSVSK